MKDKQKRIIEYFKNPDEENLPDDYASAVERSVYLVMVINQLFPDRETRILELGSGTGRNLNFLQDAGYTDLSGVEVSPLYLEAMKRHFPDLKADIQHGLLEDHVNFIQGFDLIFSMAVLEHIPISSVFDAIAKGTRFLLTIEDEVCISWRHYPRRYDYIFKNRGMVQKKVWNFPPLGNNFKMRLFKEI